jgi:photosystem II stability/assembly factor-like uncharacterized protein
MHRVVGRALVNTAGHTYKSDSQVSVNGIGGGTGSGVLTYEQVHVPAVFEIDTDEWITAAPEYVLRKGIDSWMAVSKIDIKKPSAVRTWETSGLLGIPNAVPYYFDGFQTCEQGFLHRPDSVRVTTTAAAGTLANGVWTYQAYYEWQDNEGNLHVSEPSIAVSVTAVGTVPPDSANTVSIPGYRFHQRLGVRIVVFRSDVANSAVLRRIASIDNPYGGTVNFVDTGATGFQDTTLTPDPILAQPEPYTAGGELAVSAPLPYRFSTIFQNRVFYAPRIRESEEIRYSKEILAGLAPEFSGFLSIQITRSGGNITGLQALGDKLLIFKRNRVYATHGRGYTSNGSGQNFTDPYLVSESIGCINNKSIILMPRGVMFLSDDGIYLVTRQLQAQPIGSRVRFYTNKTTIVSALLSGEDEHVIFLTKEGPALCYNYGVDQWSTWTNYEADDGVANRAGVIFFKSNAGADRINVQDQSNGYDYPSGATPARIPMKIDTSWISAAGIGGYQRIYRALMIGSTQGAHQLTVKTAYDMEPRWVDTQNFDAADLRPIFDRDHHGEDLPGEFEDNAYFLEIHGSRQKCTSVRYRFQDAETPTVFVLAAGDSVTARIEDNQDWADALRLETSEVLYSAWIAGRNSVWVLGDTNIFHWDGDSWSQEAPDANGYDFGAIFGFSTQDIFAGGATGLISRFNGSSWSVGTTDSAQRINGLWGTSPQSVYAVRQGGIISKWDGLEWDTLPSGVSTDINSIWGTGDDDIFAVGDGGVILHSEDGGKSWEQQTSGTPADLFGVFAIDPMHIFAVGAGGVARWSQDGKTWIGMTTNTVEDLYDVTMRNRSDAIAVGTNGEIISWDGLIWAVQASPTTNDLFAVEQADNAGRWSISALSIVAGVKSGVKRLGSGRNF